MLTVGILGNHSLSYCTESELDWTFEHLGHKVVRYQESEVSTEDILTSCLKNKVNLFLYIHTHGWRLPGRLTMEKLLEELQAAGITTASFHLDLYWGLNIIDQRMTNIGKHPFWKTQYVFTADGGHQEQFKERGINHHWLPPAVAERGCYRGTYRPELAVDVAFVGARSYHPEYPFRGELLNFLESTYKGRFRRINGDTTGVYREQALNDLYASVRVCVGDSCFAGIPRYWSDRVPETLGRGGFLIHPAVEGLNIPGLVTFPPQNLAMLKTLIDAYVDDNEGRRLCSELAFADVRQNHTYTNRVTRMLETMGLNNAS